MKKLLTKALTTILATSVVISSVVGLTACNRHKGDPSAKQVFSMAAASGATFLAGDTASGASGVAETRPITDGEYDTLKTYLGMFDDMLAKGVKQESSKSDKAEYETKLEISVGSNINYTMYYTEKTVNSDKVVEENDDDDEVKEATTLTGILISGDKQYDISGGRKVEIDGKETETVVYFETKGEGNEKVEVEQKHSVDPDTNERETEFEYTITDKDGNVTEYSIEWEFEDGANEMEVEIENEATNVEVSYKVKADKKDSNKLVITYETEAGDKETEQNINVTRNSDNTFTFTYSNGYVDSNVVL